jgi:hypothetical protein
MKILTYANLALVKAAVHEFLPDAKGWRQVGTEVEVFTVDTCECCGKEMQGANPITFTRPIAGDIFVAAGLTMKPNCEDDGGCNDAGLVVCLECND